MSNTTIKDKLQTLYYSYAKNLPYKLAKIENLWLNLQNHWDQKKIQELHREVHNLCGSAGTYGYTTLGQATRQLEVYLKLLINNPTPSDAQLNDIDNLLAQLNKTFMQTTLQKFHDPCADSPKSFRNNIIYILNRDEHFIEEIGKQLKESGYILRRIPDIHHIKDAIIEKPPLALIVDVDAFDEKSIAILNDSQKQVSIPLFCTADNGNILTRLKAIRMGGWVFLKKPIDPFNLTKTVNQHCGIVAVEPYRILIIDDSRSLAEYFSLILQEAGMITYFINNPLLLIETIDEFQPDLLLMDIYMPECTGLELATVLRQEIQYTKIPIIFLSTEDDRLKQLSALNLGGDDFLTKPILPQHLIESVRSRAKRAGILSSFMMRDSLTGLLNHTNILQRLDIELARAQRQGETLSFIMADIDHFKKINDNYGHPTGDKIIKALASLLYTSLRKTDVVGRYGGEEFALILPNTNKEKSLEICNYLREKFSHIRHKFNHTEFSVTFSAGISNFPHKQNAKSLISSADQALYTAKQKGRNQIIYFEDKLSVDLSP